MTPYLAYVIDGLKIRSYPKVNLALDILGKASSGYHEIQTVFQELPEPFDELEISPAPDGVLEVKCDNPKVPTDDTNTVLKAAKLLKAHMKIEKGARIFIKKRIPLMSGLGGGPSNAVSALRGLEELWKPYCHPGVYPGQRAGEGMTLLADQIGMDCAFFFHGGTAFGEHFGEKITPLPKLPIEIKFEVIETGVEVSSHDAYQLVDLAKCGKNRDKTEKLIHAIRTFDTQGILENIHNDFEEFIFEKHPKIREIASAYGLAMTKRRDLKMTKLILTGSGGALVKITRIHS